MGKHTTRTIVSILCLTVLLISTIGCITVSMPKSTTDNKTPQGDQAAPPGTAELPVIESFTASPESLYQGLSSTLSWTVKNATDLVITPEIGSVPATGSKIVKPATATTYTLVASNAAGVRSKTVTINMIAAREKIKKPDLWVKTVHVSADGKFGYSMYNIGETNSFPCKNIMLIDGQQKSVDSIVFMLPPGAMVYREFFAYKTKAANENHYFQVKIDIDNTNDELNEDNNTNGENVPWK